uniref:BTB domain-containing protein n=1 Tax=Pavo cristatus TaxID=9049 RepID=A0A8C9FQQ2_PAVCR
ERSPSPARPLGAGAQPPPCPALPTPLLLRPAQAMNFGRGPAVVLNVGGTRYSFSREVLKDFPLRRVSRLHGCLSEQDVLEVCDDYDRERNEYFFDRHSEAFGFIMLYVRHGHLRFVPHMCELSFYNELIYWGLEGSHLDYCCQRRLDDRMSETCTYYSAEEPPGEPSLRVLQARTTSLFFLCVTSARGYSHVTLPTSVSPLHLLLS